MNNAKKNIIISFISQTLFIVFGFVVPRIMISCYGSDANGLLSTITQICTYIAMLEAGISSATKNELLKSIASKNTDDINETLSVARKSYRKVCIYYIAGILVLALAMPLFFKTNVNKPTVFMAILLEGIAGIINFYFAETYISFLNVDGRGYINNIIDLFIKLSIYVIKIVLAYSGMNILFIQAFTLLFSVLKIYILHLYIKKSYSWIRFVPVPNGKKLNDRYYFMVTEISNIICNSTDLIVISIFIGTSFSSVYSVYGMIFNNLSALLGAVYFSVIYIAGQTYHKTPEEYNRIHDLLTSIFMCAITILMSTSYFLCVPFLRIYMRGITDQEYINSTLSLLFAIIPILSWSRYVSGNLTGISGYAKQTSRFGVIEATINLVASIILVNIWGIEGVLLGTVIALPLKICWCIYIADNRVMKRKYTRTITILCSNYLLFALVVIAKQIIPINCTDYPSFICLGIPCLLAITILGALINILANRDCLSVLRLFKNRS